MPADMDGLELSLDALPGWARLVPLTAPVGVRPGATRLPYAITAMLQRRREVVTDEDRGHPG